MNAEQIISLNATKTYKIQQLLQLGLSRKEVAQMMGVGYGFVQNVFAAMNQSSTPEAYRLIAFDRRFGIEFEDFNVDKTKLIHELTIEGIQCRNEGYHHSTTSQWKVVSDSSIDGSRSFELVSHPGSVYA